MPRILTTPWGSRNCSRRTIPKRRGRSGTQNGARPRGIIRATISPDLLGSRRVQCRRARVPGGLTPRAEIFLRTLQSRFAAPARGPHARAAREYQAAIDINPRRAEAYTGLGAAMVAMGKPAQAEQNYKKAIELNPKLPAPGHDLGLLYKKQRRTQDAVTAWERSIANNPDFVPTRVQLAQEYRAEGRLDDAIAQYQAVVSASPDDKGAAMALAERRATATRQGGPQGSRRPVPRCFPSLSTNAISSGSSTSCGSSKNQVPAAIGGGAVRAARTLRPEIRV